MLLYGNFWLFKINKTNIFDLVKIAELVGGWKTEWMYHKL
jgi:hypothetical protein